MNETVRIDWAIPDAVSYFGTVVLPNIVMFDSSPTIQLAMNAVQSLWNLHEWYWHDLHPNQDPGDKCHKATFAAFRVQLIKECPEISYIKDLAEAAKHCRLHRKSLPVKRVDPNGGGAGGWNMPYGGYNVGAFTYSSGQPLVTFDDGSAPRTIGDIMKAVGEFWRRKLQFKDATRSPPPSFPQPTPHTC
jgi:hypothetical protein